MFVSNRNAAQGIDASTPQQASLFRAGAARSTAKSPTTPFSVDAPKKL